MIDSGEDFEIDLNNEDELAALDRLLFIFKELKKTHVQELEERIDRDHHRKGSPMINVRILLPILESDNLIDKKGDYWNLTGTGLRYEGYLKEYFQKALDKRDEKIMKKDLQENENVVSMKNKIFISHSSKDITIVNSFVENILKLGLDIHADRIFCSSMEGQGVKSGEYIPDRLRSEMQQSSLALLFISEDYKRSEVCLNEVGAAWVSLPKENIIIFLLSNVGFSDLGFLDLGRLGLKLDKRSDVFKFVQHSKSLLNPSFNLERLESKIEIYLDQIQESKEETGEIEKQDSPNEVDEWTQCYTNNLYALNEIIRKSIPAKSDGIHKIEDRKVQNQILTDLSQAKFLKRFWYRYAKGDYYVDHLRKLPSGNWLMSGFNWELNISEMWVSMNGDLQYEFILLRSEKQDPFEIGSDVGGKDYNVGVLNDGKIVSENERSNGFAIIEGDSVDLHKSGVEPRMRKKEAHWIFLVSDYHKLGYNSDETIDLCVKLDSGEIEVNEENLLEVQRKLGNHPTVVMYM